MSTSSVQVEKGERQINKDIVPLLITNSIGKIADELVERAEKLGKDYKIETKTAGTKSPLRNVLNVATAPDTSRMVVNNFILYQAGRKDASPLWRKEPGNKSFGEALIEQINKLSELSDKIKEDVYRASEHNLTQDEMRVLNMRLIKLFLGYLNRYHVAVSSGNK